MPLNALPNNGSRSITPPARPLDFTPMFANGVTLLTNTWFAPSPGYQYVLTSIDCSISAGPHNVKLYVRWWSAFFPELVLWLDSSATGASPYGYFGFWDGWHAIPKGAGLE